GRGFAGFGRRNRLAHARAAAAADGSGAAAAAANLGSMSALMAMSDRSGRSPSRADGDGHGAEPSGEEHGGRRSRMDDLEEMMMMEAIRLSLASEEERKKKEEKEAKKEAKKKEKEGKKLEKAAKKGGMYPGSANGSALSLGKAPSADGGGPASKGKSVDRAGVSPPKAPAIVPAAASSRPEHGERLQPGDAVQAQAQAQAQTQAQAQAHANGEAYRPSHLRHVSNTSSASSFLESAPGSLRNELHGSGASFEASPDASAPDVGHGEDGNGALTPPAGAGLEPMFNFRSLAAMIGKDESWAMTEHVDGPDAKAGGALASSWGGTAQDASEKASHAQGGSAGHA
ncbi:MAG: SNF1-interacting protein, partial [Thelocarpon impressellum]